MTPQIPQMPIMQTGNPIGYRMPQMGGGMGLPASADYFSRGQQMLANVGQTMGQMDRSQDQTTTTITEQPPMTVMDTLGAGVGYGLAGMAMYDLYQGWNKDKEDPDLQNKPPVDPERDQVLGMFGSGSTSTSSPGLTSGSDALSGYAAGNQHLRTSGPKAPPPPPSAPTQTGSAMQGVSGGLGMAGGAQNMYAGYQNNNPLQMAAGAYQAYQGYGAMKGAGAGEALSGAAAAAATAAGGMGVVGALAAGIMSQYLIPYLLG